MSDGFSLPKPPGLTCPQIDRAQSALRKLAWRAHRSAAEPVDVPEGQITQEVSLRQDDVSLLLREGTRSLEEVRADNVVMRTAYTAAAKSAVVVDAAMRLVRSGYDGPFSGDAVAPLFKAVAEYEQALAKRRNR
jgi:hypothetical protein